jgi:hypothetical protein
MITSPTPCHCGVPGVFGYWRNGMRNGTMDWFCTEHRLGRWYADACRSEADANRAHAELRISPSELPDLQTLVLEHGTEFDRAMAAWQLRRQGAVRC